MPEQERRRGQARLAVGHAPPPDKGDRDLLVSHSAAPMAMWPVSLRVNSVANDDPAILERAS